MQYGYTGSISTSWRSQNEGADKLAYAVATQLLIWETVVGERDSDFSHVSTGGYNAVTEQIGASHPLRSQIFSYYSMIEANVQSHSKIPSFMSKSSSRAQDIELEWNGSEYTATLTDTNGVLGNYSFSGSGLSFSVSGNTLTITAKTALEDTVTITAEKKDSQRRGIITWSDGHYLPGNATLQDLVTYAESVNDPVTGYLHVKVSYGSAKIIKTSEDGIVSGIRFTITGNGVNETVTTGENGEIQIDNLTPGEYTVTELADDRYVPQESKTVCVVSGQTAIVEFGNILKKFSVTLTKRDSEKGSPQGDAVLSGAVYGIYHGDDLVDTYETDASGSFTTKEYVCGNGWTIREITPSIGYLLDETVYPVGAEAGNFTLEHNAVAVDVGEDVIKGSIFIQTYFFICCFFCLYSIRSYSRLKKKLQSAVLLRDNIYISQVISTPFALGLRNPKIYLPSNLADAQEYVIAHEQTHLARRDNLAKILGYVVLILHWFNPLVWLAFKLFVTDMDMLINPHTEEGYLIKQCIKSTERTKPFAERAVEQHTQHDRNYQNAELP